ncbi:MAG: hypothetical protein LBC74_11370 [Planctomycetaceae bacterium]|jgi:hypothetical protein|nr:hypothetical protein [Planctomycetaceae bacterium]
MEYDIELLGKCLAILDKKICACIDVAKTVETHLKKRVPLRPDILQGITDLDDYVIDGGRLGVCVQGEFYCSLRKIKSKINALKKTAKAQSDKEAFDNILFQYSSAYSDLFNLKEKLRILQNYTVYNYETLKMKTMCRILRNFNLKPIEKIEVPAVIELGIYKIGDFQVCHNNAPETVSYSEKTERELRINHSPVPDISFEDAVKILVDFTKNN